MAGIDEAAGASPYGPSRPRRYTVTGASGVSDAQAIPLSTYRLQLSPRFTLRDARDVVPYLDALGITHVYASPFLKARPGSEHGYDITDHNALNPEIGDWDDFVRFSDALRAREMGLILDFVPNHMGIGKADNAWWLDVLEWGRSSIYSDYFDIDWMPPQPWLKGRILLPLLGDHYGAALTRGELVLRFAAEVGSLSVWYHEHRLPVRARSYAAVIRRRLGPALSDGARRDGVGSAFERIARDLDRAGRAIRRREETRRQVTALKAELAALCARHAEAARFMADATAAYNGTPGEPDSFRALHALLERQHYRLAFWRVGADEVNYRRFFNINELAGIRMENPALFDVAHRLVGRMIREGRLQGLRLDHIDGLFDPRAYCRRLQEFARAAGAGQRTPFYVVVEKILAHHETLRAGWPIAGTTGYEFATLVNGLFVDPAGERGCDAVHRGFTGDARPFQEVLLAAKDTVIETLLAGELNVLANELERIAERDWNTRDYTMRRLRDALKAVVSHFPVYRTYVSDRRITAEDRRDIDWAVAQGRKGWRGPDQEIFDLVHAALTGDLARRGESFRRAEVLRFAMRFQQYTGPIMAKAMEDTAFYRYPRLLSLNEVGGDPRQFGVSVAAFHRANQQRARDWPHSMLATATHDTKRGEDARLRIDALSEMPAEWERRVQRWSELVRSLRREVDGMPAPTPTDEFMIYQTLLGAWPAEFIGRPPDRDALAGFVARIERYVVKAVREAKVASSWENPAEAYEAACVGFVRGALNPAHPFLAELSGFAERVAFIGMLSSLAQTVLRLTAPGVPDTYQGTESWDLSLVDPDNRVPVDFAARDRLLRETRAPETSGAGGARAALGTWPDGRIKMLVLHRLLRLRRRLANVCLSGSYAPLATSGAQADHLVAFMRRHGGDRIVVVTGRLFASLPGGAGRDYDGSAWGDSMVAARSDLAGRWHDALSGASVDVDGGESGLAAARMLSVLPAAVLVRANG
jgi:(1->4)-alpha-D-glucan 1-alpha-D-glucosylmutase